MRSITRCTTMEEERSDSQNSCYYPGCRKDANCSCKMCLASISATLDLRHSSTHKSSLTRLSTSRPEPLQTTPISFDMPTPTSNSSRRVEVVTPALKSTVTMNLKPQEKRPKRGSKISGSGWLIWRLVLGLSLVFAVETGFSFLISQVLKPVLTGEMVKGFGERSLAVDDLSGRLRLLENELKRSVSGQVSNCSGRDSSWKINQDGLLLHSSCTLYSSAVEEVRVWGWPLQTAGLLTAGFSSRSFTVLSGRVTEWSNGKVGFSALKQNSSTLQSKWSSFIVQLDPNTWVLEYKRSSMLESSRLFSAVMELLKYRALRSVSKMSEGLWLFSGFENQFGGFQADGHFKVPT